MLSPDLLDKIESFVEENKQLGFTTKEELIRDAIRFRLTWLKGEYQFIGSERRVPSRSSKRAEVFFTLSIMIGWYLHASVVHARLLSSAIVLPT